MLLVVLLLHSTYHSSDTSFLFLNLNSYESFLINPVLVKVFLGPSIQTCLFFYQNSFKFHAA